MYGWLDQALQGGAQVVTANRRLARLLAARFNDKQMADGRTAWLRPEIYDWSTWLSVLGDSAGPSIEGIVRINTHQSRILWENCLSVELSNPDANIGALVRLAREARVRLVDWQVPLSSVGEYARSDDERFFANALNAYVRLLERNAWVDDAGYSQRILEQVSAGWLQPAKRMVMVGFTSPSSLFDSMVDALRRRGCEVAFATTDANTENTGRPHFVEFLDEAQEYRAAGAWAREVLERGEKTQVAIVVSGLESKATRVGNLIREGFMPGWQLSPAVGAGSVNVSYGQPLSDYPVIATALLLLRWISGEALSAAEVGILLRSRMTGDRTFGESVTAADYGKQADESRIRTELRLREMADRNWTLDLFARGFEDTDHADAVSVWIADLKQACEMLIEGSRPDAIAESIDEALALAGWPGEASMSSRDFQVLNRWRELLNDFVRLSLVQATFTPSQAIARLTTMAHETVFQPETEAALVNVLGALEASGSEFDHLWVAGLTSKHWPPPARPLSLVSTRLQREYGMPDSTPSNTSDYAKRSLSALLASSEQVMLSFSRFEQDAEQTPSPILPDVASIDATGLDPGWYACHLVDPSQSRSVADDPAPPIRPGDTVWGGAATLDRQSYSPFSAFAFGRLGLRYLARFSPALQPVLRGNLIHDALRRLYRVHDDQASLAALSDDARSEQINDAVRLAMAAEFRLADDVLRQVLRFEEQRIRVLLSGVIDHDLARPAFSVASIEEACEFNFKSLSLRLKADRIDRLAGGRHLILDYKTGDAKKLLTNKEPNSFQLILYSLAYGGDVAALGLYNVDSRLTAINGAGQTLDDREDWDKDLAAWSAVALAHLERMIEGDLRVNAFQPLRDSRQTALLSRVAELKRD